MNIKHKLYQVCKILTNTNCSWIFRGFPFSIENTASFKKCLKLNRKSKMKYRIFYEKF